MPDSYPDPASIIAQSTPARSPNVPSPEPEPTADQDKDEGTYVEFPLPENFQPPADAKPGKTFQALATLKIDEGDEKTLCLVAIDGAPVKPEEKEEEPEEPEEPAGPEPTTMKEALQQTLPKTGIPA